MLRMKGRYVKENGPKTGPKRQFCFKNASRFRTCVRRLRKG